MQTDTLDSDTDVTIAPFYPRSGNAFTRALGRLILRVMGWTVEGELPPLRKALLICAPHTSNWDLALCLGAMLSRGLRFSWMMKREAFFFPLGPVWRALGAVEVDRSRGSSLPKQMARWFDSVDAGYLGLMPEGTRHGVSEFKRGYLHIARAADVPLFIVGIDARRKVMVLDRVWELTDDMRADNAAIRDYVRGRYEGMLPRVGTAAQS